MGTVQKIAVSVTHSTIIYKGSHQVMGLLKYVHFIILASPFLFHFYLLLYIWSTISTWVLLLGPDSYFWS